MNGLVLSLFPGIGLLDMAFEEAGFCVVRGPDLLWGGDIRRFHPPAGRFDGVIGGPPCQPHSDATIGHAPKHECGIQDFARVIRECAPRSGPDWIAGIWWVMEQVPSAPAPFNVGMRCRLELDAWDFGATQRRRRAFCSNLPLRPVPIALNPCQDPLPTVLATEHKYSAGSNDKRRAGRKLGRRMTLAEVNVAMGLPEGWATPALTKAASYEVRGNGVPLPMGRAIAQAVKAAIARTEAA